MNLKKRATTKTVIFDISSVIPITIILGSERSFFFGGGGGGGRERRDFPYEYSSVVFMIVIKTLVGLVTHLECVCRFV